MLTRRQWLQTNPRPKSPVNLQALLDQEQRTATEQQDQARNLYNQITVANSALKSADSAALNRDLTALRARQADTAKNITLLTSEIARAVKCPVHQLGLHYHRNRPEDLYICENGPHFLFWTRVDGKAQLIQVATLLLPGLDFPMTDAAKISRAEWLTQHVAQPGAFCKEHGQSPLAYLGNRPDVLVCEKGGEKYLWTNTAGAPGWVKCDGEPPSLETPVE